MGLKICQTPFFMVRENLIPLARARIRRAPQIEIHPLSAADCQVGVVSAVPGAKTGTFFEPGIQPGPWLCNFCITQLLILKAVTASSPNWPIACLKAGIFLADLL